jgi:hypothetical protein
MAMSQPTLDMKLARITEFAATANMDSLSRNLLHAYAGCMTVEEICAASIRTLDSPPNVHRAILSRLLRIGRGGGNEERLDELGVQLLGLCPRDSKARTRIDAVLSQLFIFLVPATRRAVLERWRSRGTIGARARWLKAISDDPELFRIDDVLAYWRDTKDFRAAKLLADRGDTTVLTDLLPELIETCTEGWIVSRAALNAGAVSEICWKGIRAKFPATFAYLCAKGLRQIGEAEALDLVREACATWPSDDRGLAIWALGQLGMWSALERIRGMLPAFHDETLARAWLEERSQALCPPNTDVTGSAI